MAKNCMAARNLNKKFQAAKLMTLKIVCVQEILATRIFLVGIIIFGKLHGCHWRKSPAQGKKF